MKMVTVEEFSQQLTELLKWAEETGGQILITDNGRVIGTFTGTKQARSWTAEDRAKWLADIHELANEVGKRWPEGVSAVEAVKEQRREL